MIQLQNKFDIKKIEGGLVTFVNPFSWLEVSQALSLAQQSQFHIFADGIAVVLMYRLFKRQAISRYAFDFTSVAPIVFAYASQEQKTVFLIGSKPGIASQAAEIFKNRYPQLQIMGVASGYFASPEEKQTILQEASSADIIITAMGAPVQEQVLLEIRHLGWKGTGFTCGGFLDQTVKTGGDYFPKWIDKMHLRWLYRLFDEPQRLWKRYLLLYPKFFIFFLKALTKK
jgi:N-acetylglucosaminyldiphosphoundecaprenol N-acetyl-beta-D-mannosaminyltransferase